MTEFSTQRPIRVAIIGGGMSGISQAIRLKKTLGAKVEIKVFEKRATLGGVWRDAQWPGAGVDVPIHLYSLYSDLKPDWTKLYAEQPEVLAYWEALVDKHQLRANFAFESEFVGSKWDEDRQAHTLTLRRTADGSSFAYEADVIISANGPLSKPTIPRIPGFETFEGKSFHNLRWDSSVELKNKRIAVLGNGSSGIQLIPGVAALPGVQLTQFIRSGGYFIPKINTEYSAFAKWVFRWVPFAQRLHRLSLFIESNDRWRARAEPQVRPTPNETSLLAYLRKTAPAEYLDALIPAYPLGCKRPAFDYGWLASLHRPNVHLVNTPIVRATPQGFVTSDGKEHAFDVVIFATGSDVASHGVGVNVGLRGQNGIDLQQYWKEIGGPQAYLGTAVPTFPNYFAILGANAIAGSWGFTIGCKTHFNTLLIKAMVDHGITSLQPRQDAFERHNVEVQRALSGSSMTSTACSNWWRVGGQGLITVPNFVTGFQLASITRSVRWNDWVATARPRGAGKGALVQIDVAGAVRRRRLAAAAKAVAVSLILAALGWSFASSAAVDGPAAAFARQLLEKARAAVGRVF